MEKPSVKETPLTLAIMGGYILSSKIFDLLEVQEPGAEGEIQLTDAIAALNKWEDVFAYQFEGTRYDVGEKFGFIKTIIEFAIKREDLQDKLLHYLATIPNKKA